MEIINTVSKCEIKNHGTLFLILISMIKNHIVSRFSTINNA